MVVGLEVVFWYDELVLVDACVGVGFLDFFLYVCEDLVDYGHGMVSWMRFIVSCMS